MRKLTAKILTLILISAMLVITLASCSDDTFDYENAKFSKYFTMDDSAFLEIPLNMTEREEITKDKSVEEYIKEMLLANPKYIAYTDDELDDLTEKKLSEWDMLQFYYRLDIEKDGKKEPYYGDLDGIASYGQTSSGGLSVSAFMQSSNMSAASPARVLLGATDNYGGNVVCSVLEEALMSGDITFNMLKNGNIKDNPRLDGTVGSTDVAYITYIATYRTANGKNEIYKQGDFVRLDFSITDFSGYTDAEAALYNELSFIKGKDVGKALKETKTINIGGQDRTVTYQYAVQFVRPAEEEAAPSLSVDVSFPQDYNNKELAGKKGTFYIYVDEVYKAETGSYKPVDGDLAVVYYKGVYNIAPSDAYKSWEGKVFDQNFNGAPMLLTIGNTGMIDDFANGFYDISAGFTSWGIGGTKENLVTEGDLRTLMTDSKYTNYKWFVNLSGEYDGDGKEETKGDTKTHKMSGNYTFTFAELESKLGLASGTLLTLLKEGDGKNPMTSKLKTSVNMTIEDEERSVSWTVQFASGYSPNVKTFGVAAKFPEKYSPSETYFNGATAIFDIIMPRVYKSVQTLDDDLIKNVAKYESDKTGDALVADFKEFVYNSLYESQRTEILTEASTQIWSYIMETDPKTGEYVRINVKKYPKDAVEEQINIVYSEYVITYNNYAAQDSSFTSYYATVDDFIVAANSLNDQTEDGINAQIKKEAEIRVIEKLIMYYLADRLDVTLSDEEFAEKRQEILEYYASYYGTTVENIAEQYPDESIRELVISNKVIEALYDKLTD